MSLVRANFEIGNEIYFCFAFFSSIVVHCSFAHCQRGAYLMSNYTLHIAHRFLSNLLFDFFSIYFCFLQFFVFQFWICTIILFPLAHSKANGIHSLIIQSRFWRECRCRYEIGMPFPIYTSSYISHWPGIFVIIIVVINIIIDYRNMFWCEFFRAPKNAKRWNVEQFGVHGMLVHLIRT